MENTRVRIVDIAEELGLSTATVSNVIHGKTKKISDETVKRVQQLLEERQYIPSMAGILLAQNDSRIIGVVINNHEKYEGHVLEDPFVASSLNNLSVEIEQSGYFMMVKTTTDLKDIVKFASMWNLEGIIIIGFCEDEYNKLREFMRVPFVVYDGYFENKGRICNLTIENTLANPKFIYYYLYSNYGRLMNLASGAAQQNLNSNLINAGSFRQILNVYNL